MSDESGNQPKDQKPTNQSGGNGGVFSCGRRGEITLAPSADSPSSSPARPVVGIA